MNVARTLRFYGLVRIEISSSIIAPRVKGGKFLSSFHCRAADMTLSGTGEVCWTEKKKREAGRSAQCRLNLVKLESVIQTLAIYRQQKMNSSKFKKLYLYARVKLFSPALMNLNNYCVHKKG